MASISETDDRILIKRIEEAVYAAETKGYPQFVGFLDERQCGLARATARRLRAEHTCLFGGHTEAERCFFGAFPSYTELETDLFPIVAVAFLCRDTVRLDHRQVLGTLMSLGLRREKLGDILCADGIAVVFAEETMASFIAQQVTKIGGEGVRAQEGYQGELPVFHQFEELRFTIASPRLDVIVKTLLGCSREESVRRIAAGLVMKNHTEILQSSATVCEGDSLSIRGNGRYIVDEIGPFTAKGRLKLLVRKYK